MAGLVAPDREPDRIRKFQCTYLGGNNNKYWNVEIWDQERIFRITYGRVGVECARPFLYQGGDYEIEKKVRSKTNPSNKPDELYTEIKLHTVSSGPAIIKGNTPEAKRAERIIEVANESIAGFLSTTVDNLSVEQIQAGRRVLKDISETPRSNPNELIALATKYYTLIPTKLPSKINPWDQTQTLMIGLDVEEDRLAQLEAAVGSIQTQKGAKSVFDILGATLELETKDKARIVKYIEDTKVHYGYSRYKVKQLLSVTIPGERRAYQEETRGKHKILELFHGTADYNVRHIMKTGLICPQQASNGRAFGNGIYYADKSTKSLGYASGRNGESYLFVAEVAVGDWHVAKTTGNWREAPDGKDSVFAPASDNIHGVYGGKLSYSEYIVFRPSQQTIRWVAVMEEA